jgi:tRNA-dihydrouridine synthase A
LIPYFEQQMTQGVPLHAMLRHILGLWHGMPGARKIRQQLSDHKQTPEAKLAYLRTLTLEP